MKKDLINMAVHVLIAFFVISAVWLGGFYIFGITGHWVFYVFTIIISLLVNMLTIEGFKDPWFRVWRSVFKPATTSKLEKNPFDD